MRLRLILISVTDCPLAVLVNFTSTCGARNTDIEGHQKCRLKSTPQGDKTVTLLLTKNITRTQTPILKLKTGGLRVDFTGHFVMFIEVGLSSNY